MTFFSVGQYIINLDRIQFIEKRGADFRDILVYFVAGSMETRGVLNLKGREATELLAHIVSHESHVVRSSRVNSVAAVRVDDDPQVSRD